MKSTDKNLSPERYHQQHCNMCCFLQLLCFLFSRRTASDNFSLLNLFSISFLNIQISASKIFWQIYSILKASPCRPSSTMLRLPKYTSQPPKQNFGEQHFWKPFQYNAPVSEVYFSTTKATFWWATFLRAFPIQCVYTGWDISFNLWHDTRVVSDKWDPYLSLSSGSKIYWSSPSAMMKMTNKDPICHSLFLYNVKD